MSIRFVDYPEPEVKHGLYNIGTHIRFIKIQAITAIESIKITGVTV